MKYKSVKNSFGDYRIPPDTPKCLICKSIEKGENHPKHIFELLENYIKEGTGIIDVGSNLGTVSIMLSTKLKGKGSIYSFEANPYIFDMMKYNVDSNVDKGIDKHYYNNIVSDDYSINEFPEPKVNKDVNDFEFVTYGSFGVNSGPTTGKMFEVKSLKIDDLNLNNISCLKVDVEGFDLKVLKGARETILRNSCALVFEYGTSESEYTFDDYTDFIDSLDYEIVKRIKNDYLAISKK